MAQQTSRRSFLGLSALGLAAAVAPGELVGPAVAASQPENERSNIHPVISVWVLSNSNSNGLVQVERDFQRRAEEVVPLHYGVEPGSR